MRPKSIASTERWYLCTVSSIAVAALAIAASAADAADSCWDTQFVIHSARVYAMARDSSGNLYAGGDFTQLGGVSARNIARWDGVAWSPLGSGFSQPYSCFALAFDGSGGLFAGGAFGLAKWDGTSWTGL